ncbi:MAG: hypothetical protein AABO41_11130 [Acidobacteriota bacterium]
MAGVVLLGIAQLLVFVLQTKLAWINNYWHEVFPFKMSGVSALALLLGLAAAPLANLIFGADKQIDRVIQKKGDPLELLLRKALRESKPILLTVKNGKIYLGFVTMNSSPAVAVESMKLLPLRSGYRDGADRRIHFTTDYRDVYSKILAGDPSVAEIDPVDFEIVIPLREVESANLFNPSVYEQFFSKSEPILDETGSGKVSLPPGAED